LLLYHWAVLPILDRESKQTITLRNDVSPEEKQNRFPRNSKLQKPETPPLKTKTSYVRQAETENDCSSSNSGTSKKTA
jgi:hypothetical protein